jgi:hypothetical protein
MPTYEITDNQGRTLEFSGDQPPTEDIIAQSFAQAFPNQTTADEILPPARSLREARMKQDAGQGFKYPSYGELGRYALGATQEVVGTLSALGAGVLTAPFSPAVQIPAAATAGAAGTAFGGYLEAAFLGEELDADKIIEDSLVSFGLDIALPMVGSKIPALKNLVSNLRKNGATEEVIESEVNKAIKEEVVPLAGTRESLQQTQEILQRERSVVEGGQGTGVQATLTPTQAGADTAMSRLSTRLAGFSLFGSGKLKQNLDNINQVIDEEITALLERYSRQGLGSQVSSDALGEQLNEAIQASKIGLSAKYAEGLDALAPELTAVVPTNSIKSALQRILKSNEIAEGALSELSDASRNLIQKYVGVLDTVPNMKLSDLIATEKKLGREIDEIGNWKSAGYNAAAERELVQVRKTLQNAITLAINQKNPSLAKRYRELNTWYSEARSGILPKINQSLFERAGQGEFVAVGQVLSGTGNVSKIKAMMSQIDEAYKFIPEEKRKKMVLKSPSEVKAAIREGFLHSLFTQAGSQNFNITASTFKNLASKAQKGNEAERLQAIFGEDYGTVKRLFNAMSDVSVKEDSILGSIFLRSQEYGAARGLITGLSGGAGSVGVATGAVSAPAAVGTAAVVLGVPYVMAKWATNPKVVSHILKVEKEAAELARQGRLNKDQMYRLTSGIVEYIINESGDKELSSMVNEMVIRQDYMERTADARESFAKRKAAYQEARASGRL